MTRNQSVHFYLALLISAYHFQGYHMSGKCQGKTKIFLQVREKSGNFEKMSGNFGHFTNVKELSANFVMR